MLSFHLEQLAFVSRGLQLPWPHHSLTPPYSGCAREGTQGSDLLNFDPPGAIFLPHSTNAT